MLWDRLPPKAKRAATFIGMAVGTGGIGLAFFFITYHIFISEAMRKGAIIEWQGLGAMLAAIVVGYPIGVIVG